jgi:hypothetical protein
MPSPAVFAVTVTGEPVDGLLLFGAGAGLPPVTVMLVIELELQVSVAENVTFVPKHTGPGGLAVIVIVDAFELLLPEAYVRYAVITTIEETTPRAIVIISFRSKDIFNPPLFPCRLRLSV